MPSELADRFSRKQWKDCCGKGCKKCEIAQAYVGEHGKKTGLELLNEDRAQARKGKTAARATGDGKRQAKGGKKQGDGKKQAKGGKKAKKA